MAAPCEQIYSYLVEGTKGNKRTSYFKLLLANYDGSESGTCSIMIYHPFSLIARF